MASPLKITDRQKVDFDHIWNVKCFIHYHHESKDFHRVMIFIEEWTTFLCNIISKMKRILLITPSNMVIQNQTHKVLQKKKRIC